MIYNLELWLKAIRKPIGLSHYHRVNDGVYFSVCEFLTALLCVRLKGKGTVGVTLTDELCEAVLLFISQMENGYRHPRSTSQKTVLSVTLKR